MKHLVEMNDISCRRTVEMLLSSPACTDVYNGAVRIGPIPKSHEVHNVENQLPTEFGNLTVDS